MSLLTKSAATKHYVRTYVAELVDKAAAADNGEIIDHHFACELCGVAHYHVVAYHTVVCDMGVCHQQGVRTYDGLAFRGCAAVYGGAFAQCGSVADYGYGFLAAEFEILGNGAYNGTGENGDVTSDTGAGENGDVAPDLAAFTDLDVTVDSGERADENVVGYFGIGIYASQIMNHDLPDFGLFVLDDLGHELAFAHHFLADESAAFHHGHAAAQGCHERYMEDEGIAGNDFLTELHVVYLHEVCRVAFGLVDNTEYQQAAGLSHGLYEKYAGHDGFLREMALEERFVGGDVLDADDIVVALVDYLVDKKEGIAVGQIAADGIVVHQRLGVGIVGGSLYFLTLDFRADSLCKLR